MPEERIAFLMYHEIESSGRALCSTEPGYLRYVVRETDFREQLECVRDLGCTGVSVGEALSAGRRRPAVAITFDDGCVTDWLVAAPLLAEFAFGATFYVIAGSIGSPGYLSAPQLRDLVRAGFEIGSHSMTHSYLNRISADRLRRELWESRNLLEEMCQAPVTQFSCPGGRWSRQLERLAEEAGYQSVATSRVGVNGADGNRFNLARLAVMRDTRITEFAGGLRGHGLAARRVRFGALKAAKAVLGNSVYERVRAAVLDDA